MNRDTNYFLPIRLVMIAVCAVLLAPVLALGQENSCAIDHAIYGTPGNYTFSVPAGVTSVRILSVGAGGGGGAGSGGWGSGGGGACGGALSGGTMNVTPGQKIPLYVGYGGTGGNGRNQQNPGGCPWCGFYDPSSNGSPGGNSGIGAFVAQGGSWGRTGYHNLYNQSAGGSGGGSGGGGGGNGWPGFYATAGSGGAGGGQTNNQGAGGYCTGGGWGIDPATYITKVSVSAGAGGYAPGGWQYWGGGGGGGVVIDGTAVKGGDGQDSNNNGGKGFGAGGGGASVAYTGAGGNGAPGAVYIEWDNSGAASSSCALSCSITFDKNPLTGNSTKIRWTSQNASLFYINTIGYVSGSGSAQISAPGDYSGQVAGIGSTASCPAVLSGTNACTPTSQSCQADGSILNSCGVKSACRFGCSAATNTCNDVAQCQAPPVCDAEGHKVISACDGSSLDDCAAQGLACVAGRCRVPSVTFVPFDSSIDTNGHLSAVPRLVGIGGTTRLYWNVVNALSCSVTGSNGDGVAGSATGAWDTLSSGLSGKTTSALISRTVFTLLCHANTGAIPALIQESVTVNIVPNFQEL